MLECIAFESTTRIRKTSTVTQSSFCVAFLHYAGHILQNHTRLPVLSNFEIAFLRALHPRKHSSLQALLRFKCCIHLQSFYFYIPHKRLKPGGHLHHTFLSTPSLDTLRCCSLAYHQTTILNSRKLFCKTLFRIERQGFLQGPQLRYSADSQTFCQAHILRYFSSLHTRCGGVEHQTTA